MISLKKSFERPREQIDPDMSFEISVTSAKNNGHGAGYPGKSSKTHKVILLGDPDVGKTSIFTRLT